MMESPDLSPPHTAADRPSLGFPLGTALLLIVIFSLSGIFSCCYHWERLRSLRQSSSDGADPEADPENPPWKSAPPSKHVKRDHGQTLPVLMPGDGVPKFIALPSPRQPPREDKTVVVKVQKPVKPPRLPVPLY